MIWFCLIKKEFIRKSFLYFSILCNIDFQGRNKIESEIQFFTFNPSEPTTGLTLIKKPSKVLFCLDRIVDISNSGLQAADNAFVKISFYTNPNHCGSGLKAWQMLTLWKHLSVLNRNTKHFSSFVLQFTGRQIKIFFFSALYISEWNTKKNSLCISGATQFAGDRKHKEYIKCSPIFRLLWKFTSGIGAWLTVLQKRDTHLGICGANADTHTHPHTPPTFAFSKLLEFRNFQIPDQSFIFLLLSIGPVNFLGKNLN